MRELLEEYDLELDDLRWYLSVQTAERLLTYTERSAALAELIWRGTLEDDLYDMEDRFIKDTQELLERGLVDEAKVREQLSEAVRARRLRR